MQGDRYKFKAYIHETRHREGYHEYKNKDETSSYCKSHENTASLDAVLSTIRLKSIEKAHAVDHTKKRQHLEGCRKFEDKTDDKRMAEIQANI